MSETFHRTEGIILRIFPFRDYDQILVLFTQDAGIIKLIYKGSRSKKRGVQGICMPLTRVEVVFKEKQSELFVCQEMALLDSYRSLRKQLAYLEAGCDLLQLLYTTQLVGKPAPQLYALLKFYLEKIPYSHPELLTTSFRLKLLKHEGLITFPLQCGQCQEILLTEAYFHQGELFCHAHQIPGLFLQEIEVDLLYALTECQRFQDLIQIPFLLDYKIKIDRFFKARIQE
jgi:DNA repair protein RecO (recombination protein O)